MIISFILSPISSDLLMIPRLSLNHLTHAPAMAIAPCKSNSDISPSTDNLSPETQTHKPGHRKTYLQGFPPGPKVIKKNYAQLDSA